ncbi:Presequence protease, mitochondrial [Exaiptasia diaphana]|nr:Presequence protease, mitochondrial [Exaiptasia diaphana]
MVSISVLFMKNLLETEDLDEVIQTLKAIAVHVLEGTQFRCAVNVVPESRSAVEAALEGYCDSLPGAWTDTSGMITDLNFEAKASKVHFELPFPVNYSSQCVNSVPYNHEDYAKLRILARLLSSKFLHREIREKGGAYGGGAKLGGGVFSFYSYRDPNSVDTLDAFNRSVEWAEQGQFTDLDIDEAKLAVFASVDSPVSPGNRGLGYFSQGVTDEMKQTQRDRLFAVTRDDLIDVTRRFPTPSLAKAIILKKKTRMKVLFMKNLLETEDLDEVIQTLKAIAVHVLEGTQFRCAVNVVPESRSAVEAALEGYCDSLPGAWTDTSGMITDLNFEAKASKVHFELPFPVNYSSQCVNSVPYNHEDYAKLRILARLLSSKFLHREIREKGGAYGGGAKLGGGVFSFYSYRDPNSVDTLDAFNRSVEWAEQGQFTDLDIDEAKLAVFASVDSPVSPGNRGLGYFSQGVTDEMKQTQRDRLFAVTRDDLIDVTRRYLSSTSNSVALLGPENERTSTDSTWTIRKETL